jgi:topoisomerase-4 subunit A
VLFRSKEFQDQLLRTPTKDDVERLLEIKIKRISRFDIKRQQKEIKEIRLQISEIQTALKDMVAYSIKFLDDLLTRYGHLYPRMTEITSFSEVSVRNVALSNLTVGYNRKSGFLGTTIKEEDAGEDMSIACSEYDRLFLIFASGIYKIIPVTEKIYVGEDLYWLGILEKDITFNLIYRDGSENLVYVKRFTTPSFILDKEYHLFTEHPRSKILMLDFGEQKFARIVLAPSSRARSNTMDIVFDEYLVKNVAAKGKRVSNRVVRRVTPSPGPNQADNVKQVMTLPGLEPSSPAPEPENQEPDGGVEQG